jgi:hypothetical protein
MPRILVFAFATASTFALLGSGFAANDHPNPAPGANGKAQHQTSNGSAPTPVIGDSGSIANSSGGGMVSPSYQDGAPNTSQTAAPPRGSAAASAGTVTSQ